MRVTLDANYMAAVCYRYQNDYAKAQQHASRALKEFGVRQRPSLSRAGAPLPRARVNVQLALVAYQTACQLNPALIAGWKAHWSNYSLQ